VITIIFLSRDDENDASKNFLQARIVVRKKQFSLLSPSTCDRKRSVCRRLSLHKGEGRVRVCSEKYAWRDFNPSPYVLSPRERGEVRNPEM
jgi:hypothetical protein